MSLQEPSWANQTKTTWTDDRTEQLILLHEEGKLSCAGMARALGGVSRNAVIGKLSRLGLSVPMIVREKFRQDARLKMAAERIAYQAEHGIKFERAKREKGRRSKDTMSAREQNAAELRARFECLEIVDLPPDQSAVAVSFFNLSKDTCRWPLGDPRDLESMKFCGTEPFQEYPYCKRHCLQAYRLPAKETRRSTVKPSCLTARLNW